MKKILVALILLISSSAFSQCGVLSLGISVMAFGAVGDGVADDTAPIQAAINSGNKTVFMPHGRYKVTSTIRFGDGISTLNSFHFYGEGSNENGAYTTRGSTFIWAGSAAGTVVEVTSASNCVFEHFSIDGGGTAGNGLLVDAKNSVGSNFANIFTDISISALPSGTALLISGNQFSLTNQDVSQSTYNNISIYPGYAGGASSVSIGIKQEGTQTVANRFYNPLITGCTSRGIDVEAGDFVCHGGIFNLAATGANIDDIYISPSADWVQFYDDYHEIFTNSPSTRHAFNFPNDSGSRIWSSTLIGVRILWSTTSGNPLYFKQAGRLAMIGGSFDSAPSGASTVHVENTAPCIFHGVLITNFITYSISGSSSIL